MVDIRENQEKLNREKLNQEKLNQENKNSMIRLTNCNHIYCNDCTHKIIEKTEKGKSINCSLCRGKIKKYDFQDEYDMCNIMHLLAYKK